MKFNKALVTGGAGFIGSHIAAQLLAQGIETVVLDNFSMGKREYIPKGATIIEADVLDTQCLIAAMSGVDIVFHQAARVSIRSSIVNFYEDAQVNIMGTIIVIQAMIKNEVKKMIYASSMGVYGEAASQPITEDHPQLPNTPYGISKLTSERYCLLMSQLYNFEAAVLRYFNTYGSRQTLTPYVGVITIFIQRLLQNRAPMIFGDGKQIRDFVSVEDVAQANMLAMATSSADPVFNIGSGKFCSVNDIAALLIARINPHIQAEHVAAQPGEPRSAIADISKAREILGYNPRTGLEDKIDEIIDWNRSHPA